MRGSGNMYRGGGGSGMTLSLPPFSRIVKLLLFINTGVFLLMLLMRGVWPAAYDLMMTVGGLIPAYVLHGAIWQLVTYAFIHLGFLHLLFNMLALWMFGSQFEIEWGERRFLEFYFFCVVGAAISTMMVGYAGLWALKMAVSRRLEFGRLLRRYSAHHRHAHGRRLGRHLRAAHRLWNPVWGSPDLHVPVAVLHPSQVHGWHLDLVCPGRSFAGGATEWPTLPISEARYAAGFI